MALDLETAREAAMEAVKAFEEPSNEALLTKAKHECEGDIQKFFQVCIPLATNILGGVVNKYGFESSQMGCMHFTNELAKYKHDPDIARLEQHIKSKFIPYTATPTA